MPRLASFVLLFVLLASGCGGGSTEPPPPPPECTLTPASIDFGAVMVGGHRDTTVTVTNAGDGTLTGTFTESCGDFAVVGSGSYSLGAGQSASVAVRFQPTAAGGKSCSVASGSGCALTCTGSGTSATVLACAVNPTSIDFGTVAVGQTVDRTFTLTNLSASLMAGTITDTSSVITIPGTSAYSLAPGQSATFIARFAPQRPGTASAVFATGQAGCPTVSCTGAGQAVCAVSPTALDFGIIPSGTAATRTFTVTNVGPTVLTSTGPVGKAPGGDGFSLSGPSTYALTPGQSLTYTVTFSTIFEGLFTCTIRTGNPGCPEVTCTAQAQKPCNCDVNPTALNFGEVVVGNEATRTFTIHASSPTLIGGTLTAVGEGLYVHTIAADVKTLGYSINGGTSQTFTLRYAPKSLGDMQGYLAISQTACTRIGSPCDTVRCFGSGITTPPPPVCAVSGTNFNLGTFSSGVVKDTTFTLTNTGGGTLSGTVRFLDTTAWPFDLLPPTSYALTAGASHTFTVRYTAPTVQAGHTQSDVRQLDLGTGCLGVGPVTVQATAVPPPSCGLSTTLLDFGTVAIGQSKDLTVDLRNNGGGTLCGTMSEICPDFAVIQNDSYCVTSPAFVRVTVRFTPTGTGTKQCTVNPGSGCPALTVRGTGN